MDRSESINELITALAVAQAQIEPPLKVHTAEVVMKSGGKYAYTYTGLAEAIEASRKPLNDNGLVLIQIPQDDSSGDCVVESVIAHKSGQWISGTIRMSPMEKNPQGFGSCLTYCRRYSALMVLGLAPEDDDANAAMGDGDKSSGMPDPMHPVITGDTPHYCQVHKCKFYENTKDGSTWWSHKIAGSNPAQYCNEDSVEKIFSKDKDADRHNLCAAISVILKKSGANLADEMAKKFGGKTPDVPQLQSWLADLETSFENL